LIRPLTAPPVTVGGSGWTQLGKTEAKKDDLNPSWAKLFLVEFHFESVQQLKVEVYDQDSSSPDRLKEQDFIGRTEFTLGQLMGAPGQSGSFLLTQGKSLSKHQGSLLVKAEEAKASSEAARFRFSASALANMDGMFSKSDPFLVISRLREDGASWTQVHRTETINNNLNPNWRRVELPMQQLCNGDYRRPLSLQVFDEDSGGRSELIGQVQTTLEEIQSKRGTNFVLHNEALRKKKGKKYTNAGLLVVAEMEIYREHTFIDYCELCPAVAAVLSALHIASLDDFVIVSLSVRSARRPGDELGHRYRLHGVQRPI
jgi:Ca2+-dependent lipid-binding protein